MVTCQSTLFTSRLVYAFGSCCHFLAWHVNIDIKKFASETEAAEDDKSVRRLKLSLVHVTHQLSPAPACRKQLQYGLRTHVTRAFVAAMRRESDISMHGQQKALFSSKS